MKPNSIKILHIDSNNPLLWEQLAAAGFQNEADFTSSKETIEAKIANYHGIVIRSRFKIDKKFIDKAINLQFIARVGAGLESIDCEYAISKNIQLIAAPEGNSNAVGEQTLGILLSLFNNLNKADKEVKSGQWNRESNRGYELDGKTVGIIGYGNIGTQLSIMAEAMGMKIQFYDIETKLPLGNAKPAKSIKDIVSSSDIISLHVPETSQTKNLISAEVIKQFKQGAILINYARGEVVDLEALSKAIKSKAVSGAAIDVYPLEPEKNGDKFETPMQGLSNVILTPHIGGSTEEAQENIGEDVSIKLYQYLERGVSNGSHSIPSIGLPPVDGAHRILHIHNNVPGVLSAINTVMSKNKINIVGQYLKTNDEIGYVVLDVDSKLSKTAIALLKEVKHTIRARMLY